MIPLFVVAERKSDDTAVACCSAVGHADGEPTPSALGRPIPGGFSSLLASSQASQGRESHPQGRHREKQPTALVSSLLSFTKPNPAPTPQPPLYPSDGGGSSGGGREEEEQGRAGVGAGAPLRRLDAHGRRAAAQAAAPPRSAPELRPAPTRQALRPSPHPASAKAGERRQGPQGRRRPAAGASPVAVARAGGGGQAGGRGRHQRRPRGAARAGLRRAVRAPPLGHDAGGRELPAPRRRRRRCGPGPGPRGGRLVGRARRLRRRQPRAWQVPLLNQSSIPRLPDHRADGFCKPKTILIPQHLDLVWMHQLNFN